MCSFFLQKRSSREGKSSVWCALEGSVQLVKLTCKHWGFKRRMLLHESQRFMLDNAMNTVSSTLPLISLNLTLTLWQDYATATLQCMKTWHLTGITSQIKGRWWQAPSEKPDTNCPTSLLISTFWKMSNLVQLQLQPTVMEDFFLPPTEVLNVNCFLSNKALFIVTMFNIKNVTGQDKHGEKYLTTVLCLLGR